jgi:hypothetical protein
MGSICFPIKFSKIIRENDKKIIKKSASDNIMIKLSSRNQPLKSYDFLNDLWEKQMACTWYLKTKMDKSKRRNTNENILQFRGSNKKNISGVL